MKKTTLFFPLFIAILFSCSSGKKAFNKGDYYSAVSQAVDRLKSSPDNKNATKVLKEGYPVALDWTQEEMDQVLSSSDPFKWEHVFHLMERVNSMSDQIRSTPAARKIIANPKVYTTELNTAREKAAEARYNAGIKELETDSREAARRAYDHFSASDQYIHGYKNVQEMMQNAKEKATINIILETIPAPSQRYQLSSEFFYNQILEYVNAHYGPGSFVNFWSPVQAQNANFDNPDFVINMEFFDISIGNLSHNEKEETVEKKVKVESKDTTRVQYKTYSAKLKTYTDQVISGGTLRFRIVESAFDKMISDELIPGSFTWINKYAMYVGDIQALDNNQLNLTKNKVLPLPDQQDLFIQMTKPVYDQVIQKINRFCRNYN